MKTIATVALYAFVCYSLLGDIAIAQRRLNSTVGRSGGIAVSMRSHPTFDSRALAHRGRFGHSARVPSGSAPVIVYGGESIGSADNCILERREFWNGWATLRELVTVCR
jgi:hypothetical protein